MSDPAYVVAELSRMRTDRGPYETAWRDIRALVRPNTVDFGDAGPPGDVRGERMYDGTAMQANTDLAAALHSYLVNPAERFFGIEADSDPETNRADDVLEWCEGVADSIFGELSNDRSGFTSAIHEAFLDVGSFGNAIVNQEISPKTGHLVFRTYPLASCFFEENADGQVNRLYRVTKMSVAQIKSKWPSAMWPGSDTDKGDRCYNIIHAVEPRENREYGKEDKANKPYSSCWILEEKKALLSESGYNSFPYHVIRWMKVADEIYGRGPAINALPDIRMLNRMALNTIKAASKAVSPALVLPSDGFLLPFSTAPDAINYRDPTAGEFEVQVLEHRGNFPVTLEMMQQERDFIQRCFYSDWVKLMPKKERQTQYEVGELVAQQLRMMAPMTGRIYTEFLVPLVERAFELLNGMGKVADAPEALKESGYRVTYISPAARAQTETKAVAMGKYVQEIIPISQVDPSILDRVNLDNYAEELALIRKISRRIIRSDADVAAIRNGREQQQQAAQMAGAAEPVSKAILNLSQAQAAGNIF